MKKILLLTLVLIAFTFNNYAQEDSSDDYNKFSIEAMVGSNKPDANFADGYFSVNDGTYMNFNSLSHFNLGVRYMFNEKFGLKFGGSYDVIKPQKSQNAMNSSLPFESRQYKFGLEGVMNLRNVLNFDSFTKRFGLLAHGGIQVSRFAPQTRNSGITEDNGGFMFGLTPQFRISNRLVVTGDVTFIQNTRQHLYWDGGYAPRANNLESSMLNVSVGLTYYIGKHEKHADWVDTSAKSLYEERVEELEERLAKVETDMLDTDKDGVPDYLDREPNTTSGVMVNTKGESIDLNNNGIPDELERTLEKMYVTKEFGNNTYAMAGVDDVKPDANDNLLSVYFRFDSTQPEAYSLNAIDRIVRYMKKYPEEKAVLVGYTDQLGNDAYNNKLSEDRAKRVYDIIVASGIDESRLSYKGGGVDDSKDKNSSDARQLLRRVSFELIEE